MKNVEAVRYKQRLDHLFKQVSALSDDIELQSHWAKYLCILVSGFIENSVRAIYTQYAREKAIPYVANYVTHKLKGFTNPNMEDILGLAGMFNPEWRTCLERNTEGELKAAVDSIVANRNLIAHGTDVGISFVTIRTYYQSAVKVIELIENTCV
jgi:hypothetical protein